MTVNEELKSIPELINKTFPIPARFRSKLPHDIAELSRLLTSSRGERSLSYLGRPNLLSAYLHYYMPWNIYRLCLSLLSLKISLSANDAVLDLGSGPLTFVSALWIARPDLRTVPLEFFCVDRSGQALEAGKKFFSALSGDSPWKIKLIREELNFAQSAQSAQRKQRTQSKSKLVIAINIFNELYERIPHNNIRKLRNFAVNTAEFLHKQAAEDAYILTVEPGVPQSGRFIAFLREAFLELGRHPASPCTHGAECPLAGSEFIRAKKWCHFAHENFTPPKDLVKLSAAARLPKERLVYSYLLTGVWKPEKPLQAIRIISDAFSLPDGKTGCYGCCEQGLVLLCGNKDRMKKFPSGSIVTEFKKTNRLDSKSGAVIIEV